MSVASYTPKSEIDYGTLSCWASNEVGDQKRPCIFHVIPAGNAKKMERRFEIIKSTTATFPSLKGRPEIESDFKSNVYIHASGLGFSFASLLDR